MEKVIAVVAVLWSISASASSFDPFINPIKKLELEKKKQKALEVLEQKQLTSHIPKLFKPAIKKPFLEYTIEGTIMLPSGKTVLVLSDPSTGETILLKEGDAIAVNAKVAKILPTKIVVYEYEKKGRRLIKKVKTYNLKERLGG